MCVRKKQRTQPSRGGPPTAVDCSRPPTTSSNRLNDSERVMHEAPAAAAARAAHAATKQDKGGARRSDNKLCGMQRKSKSELNTETTAHDSETSRHSRGTASTMRSWSDPSSKKTHKKDTKGRPKTKVFLPPSPTVILARTRRRSLLDEALGRRSRTSGVSQSFNRRCSTCVSLRVSRRRKSTRTTPRRDLPAQRPATSLK